VRAAPPSPRSSKTAMALDGRHLHALRLDLLHHHTANMLKGAGKVISQAAGGEVGVNYIVIAMTVIFFAYSFIGGLVATAWTDSSRDF